MNTLERLKELSTRFDNPEIGFLADDVREVMDGLGKLLAFVDAWDDCQTVTANQVEKMCVLLSSRKALDEAAIDKDVES